MLRYVPILLLTASVPAFAQAPAAQPANQTQPAAPVAKENPLDKVVCRTEETIGSRLKKHKVCATLREWKDQEEENREAVDRIQRNTDIAPSG